MGNDHSTRMGATMPVWHIAGETPEEGEWPARDRVPFMREPEVTSEMIAAGISTYNDLPVDSQSLARDLMAVYRAMAAVSPVALVSDAERALIRCREEQATQAKRLRELGIELVETVSRAGHAELECAALRAELAALTMTFVPDPPKPDFTRDFSGDRRRMGLA